MFKRSKWLEKYGLVPKIFLAGLLFVSIGGFDFVIFLKENSSSNHRNYSHNAKLQRWDSPPSYNAIGMEDWIARKKAVSSEIQKLYQQAVGKGDAYSVYDYFHDYEKLMALEDKYNLFLTVSSMGSPLKMFVNLRDRKGILNGKPVITAVQLEYVNKVQQQISKRRGEGNHKVSNAELWSGFLSLLLWLSKSYCMTAIFCFFIYLIRFQERKIAELKVGRHNPETGYFYETYEKQPGSISLQDELLLCPGRFMSRVILWPFYCLKYPFYETTSEMLRFNRLKAEFLRYMPLGYQLTPREEAILLAKARKPVKDIEQAIASLFQFPALVRRSVYLGYLSLVLGVLCQPAICLAASYSKKVDNNFYGQGQIVLVEQQKDAGAQIRDGTGPPQHDQQHDCFGDVIYALDHELAKIKTLVLIIFLEVQKNLKEIIFAIEKIPISRLFSAMRCLTAVNQTN